MTVNRVAEAELLADLLEEMTVNGESPMTSSECAALLQGMSMCCTHCLDVF